MPLDINLNPGRSEEPEKSDTIIAHLPDKVLSLGGFQDHAVRILDMFYGTRGMPYMHSHKDPIRAKDCTFEMSFTPGHTPEILVDHPTGNRYRPYETTVIKLNMTKMTGSIRGYEFPITQDFVDEIDLIVQRKSDVDFSNVNFPPRDTK